MMAASSEFVSVVVPLYNMENEVGRALRSIVNQTHEHFEVVVVDDGSTDQGAAVAEKMGDPRIRVVRQPNRGVSAARNRGIEEARFDLIAFLDADDEWGPDFLRTVLTLRSDFPSCAVFGTAYEVHTEEGRRAAQQRIARGIIQDYYLASSQSEPILTPSTVMVERQALALVGGFPEGTTQGEDLLTWARLASQFPIAYEAKLCATIHQHWVNSEGHLRLPAIPDKVGEGLEALLTGALPAWRASLRAYIAHWHVMRASIWLQHGFPRKARQELRLSGLRSLATPKGAVFIVASCMPSPVSRWFIRAVQSHRRRAGRAKG